MFGPVRGAHHHWKAHGSTCYELFQTIDSDPVGVPQAWFFTIVRMNRTSCFPTVVRCLMIRHMVGYRLFVEPKRAGKIHPDAWMMFGSCLGDVTMMFGRIYLYVFSP